MTLALRSTRPVVIAALALAAWLQAQGLSALLAARFASANIRPAVAVLADPPAPPRSAEAILMRNPFDSTTGDLLVGPAAPPAYGEAACDDVHALVIAASDDPARSMALLRFGDEIEPRLLRVGDSIVTIDPWAVVVDRGGTRCVARLFRPATVRTSRTAVHPATLATGVRTAGAGRFVVDRGVRDALLESAAKWVSTVAVRPERVGDDIVGLRVTAIRAGSPAEGFGLRAGDILQAVNGIPLNLPRKMVQALDVVRTASRLDVVVIRDGQPLHYVIDIR